MQTLAPVEQSKEELSRVDALEKVLGKTRYTTDMIDQDVLYLRIVRSPHAHATIKRIDFSHAEKIGGVVKVVTAKDVPGANEVGFFIQDQPLFCDKKVRFIGDAVAMVIAETPEAAELGVKAVEVDYEPLPAVFDPKDALRDGAVKIHETGNFLDSYFVQKGDVEEGFRKADIIVKGTYQTPVQEQAYLETEAALAYPTREGITVLGSLQCPFAVEKAVKIVLGKAVPNVRIILAPTGGAFGGKEDAPDEVCARAALGTYLTKKPTLLAFSRKESTIFHPKRHPIMIEREMGVTHDGKITAVKANVVLDGGAYASLSSRVLFQSVCLVSGAYDVPNVRVDGVVAYTNKVPMGAFRGFGKPQALFAAELQMDEAAEQLQMDPFEFRRKNILRVGSRTATGQLLSSSVGLEECLLKAAEESSWKSKRTSHSKPQSSVMRRGIGMACMIHPTSLGPLGVDVGSGIVQVADDGSIHVRTGMTEYGQGIYTGFVKIVARTLGLKNTRIAIEMTDTSRALDSGPTVASRSTVMGGKAIYLAAKQLQEKMAKVAAEILSCSPEELVWADDNISAHSSSKELTFDELASECRRRGVELKEEAWNRATGVNWDKEKGEGSPWKSYSWAVHVAEVQVDSETGKVDVLNYVAAHDSGTVLVPTQFKSQIYGGVVQGLGYALMEELLIHNGKIMNPSFLDYYIPTAADIPTIKPILVEAPDPENGPFGAKGIGEPPIEPVAAAVANAVYNALGFPIREFPYTPERVRMALAAKEE
ncbi:MAG: xanthine dehydrogenase family protein molybdopterin-binding subunit [Candidatus Bathyarchaeia archaeon]|jgi:CO/xanthine dehydrogenase Mo-binding subunit